MVLDVIRLLILASQRENIKHVTVSVAVPVADFLNNRKRHELARIEDEGQMTIEIVGVEHVSPEHLAVTCKDADHREVRFP